MTITLDIEEGFSGSHDVMAGWDYTRVAMVEDANYGGSTDDLIVQAEAALSASYDPSPGSLTGIVGKRGTKYRMGSGDAIVFLKTFIPEIISPTCVKFRIVYRGYPSLIYDCEGSLNQIESNIDVNKKVIVVSYTYPANYGSDANGGDSGRAGKRYVQGILVPRDEIELAFTVRFLITTGNIAVNIRGTNFTLTNANATDIMTLIAAFQGTCNNDDYTIGVVKGTKHKWKIVRSNGSSQDNGLTYQCAMTFQYRPTGWDKRVTFVNPDTGCPPADLVISTVKVTDSNFPEYAGIPPTATPDIGSTIAATADESTFPSFGDVLNATFPLVKN